jgi:hypothetical protein
MSGRNERFVRTAKRLLALQVAAGLGAAAVTAWAALEVAGLARERDALAARVAQLEAAMPRGLIPPELAVPAAPDNVSAADVPEGAIDMPATGNSGGSTGGNSGGSTGGSTGAGGGGGTNMIGNSTGGGSGGETVACELYPNRAASRCPVPWRRYNDDLCLDVQSRPAYCPRVRIPDPDPTDNIVSTEEPAPAPARDCRTVQGRAIVCVPPYRRTPVPGVCLDGNNRPMRCPPTARDPDKADDSDQQQQPLTRR